MTPDPATSPPATLPPADRIKAHARSLGFDLVGIAPATPSAFADFWHRWLHEGRQGEMTYLSRRLDERLNPAQYLPNARSAVCLAINYHVPLPPPPEPLPDDAVPARIARYALPGDYHDIIKDKLKALADFIRDTFPGTRTRLGVDTAPIPERELAARAGLGWVGKNTCLIHPRVGSYLFLATVLTTLDLPPDTPDTDHCGSCTRCLDACPTDALHPDRPYQLDPRQCISYLTIEHRSPHTDLPPDLQSAISPWLYGCDICQDVCPFNNPHRIPAATDPALQPRLPHTLDARVVPQWTDHEWFPFSRRTALRRLGLPLLQRNAQTILASQGRRSPPANTELPNKGSAPTQGGPFGSEPKRS